MLPDAPASGALPHAQHASTPSAIRNALGALIRAVRIVIVHRYHATRSRVLGDSWQRIGVFWCWPMVFLITRRRTTLLLGSRISRAPSS
jgi:hypothetical protein